MSLKQKLQELLTTPIEGDGTAEQALLKEAAIAMFMQDVAQAKPQDIQELINLVKHISAGFGQGKDTRAIRTFSLALASALGNDTSLDASGHTAMMRKAYDAFGRIPEKQTAVILEQFGKTDAEVAAHMQELSERQNLAAKVDDLIGNIDWRTPVPPRRTRAKGLDD
ncbi:MAG: hypothetical protein WAX89_00865 [Alphaproteobacteria bacterium]